MEEFTFGSLATDELKLIHHRAARGGLMHGHDLTPRDPLPGEPVTLQMHLAPGFSADRVACYYTVDNTEPAGNRGVATNGHVLELEPAGVAWDTFVWGYIETWRGVLPAQPEGTVLRYRIGAWSGEGPETFADWPDVKATVERAAHAFFRQLPTPAAPPLGDPVAGQPFAYSVDRLAAPAWAHEAVIYQVFVDRFFPGKGREWLQTEDLLGFCGGTLWGLAEKMDYIAELGANCLWLSPIFPSPTHHGYDATDITHIEPRLGGDDALRAVVDEAHARGIHLLLDYVCNHVSHKHPIFLDAQANPESRYRRWFTFDDSEIGYRTYFGVARMPEVNLANPEAREWLIGGARYWLREFAVDGFRLDHANGPGPDFWTDFWTACKAEKPDCYCFGEVVDTPYAQLPYLGRLDGLLDFGTADAMRRTFALGTWTEDHLARFLARHRQFFPASFVMPTFIDNHDMDRFLFLAGGDRDALKRAAALQMRLPGPPIIYYGTEVGLTQKMSIREGHGMHINRVPMIWGADQDRELLAYYQDLIRTRRR
jgi:cyclomaltodextrinase